MRADIEKLMAQRNLDALLILGPSSANPPMYYVTGGAGLGKSVYLHRRGHAPHLIYNLMERDAAQATGLDCSAYPENDFPRFIEENGGDNPAAWAAFLAHVFKKNGVQGRVGVYGMQETARIYPILRRLGELPGVEVAEETGPRTLFEDARITKDAAEVDRVRQVGLGCYAAYDAMKAIIRAGHLVDGKLFGPDNAPVRIGTLREALLQTFAAHNVMEDHGSIIAQGKDGTAPHNHGTDSDILREGASIVVDIFPREPGGGYFFDITRMLCVGQATPRLREVYADVKEALLTALGSLKVGERCYGYQARTCDLFEAKGYATIRQDSRCTSGYVHGLGHGVGLDIHEAPSLGGSSVNPDVLAPGHLFTVEPGLYLPEDEVAVRLEDIVWIHPDGTPENITTYPYDLEVFPAG